MPCLDLLDLAHIHYVSARINPHLHHTSSVGLLQKMQLISRAHCPCPPASATLPFSITTIWSHWAAVLSRCATKIEVRPLASTLRASKICFSVWVSRADVACSVTKPENMNTQANSLDPCFQFNHLCSPTSLKVSTQLDKGSAFGWHRFPFGEEYIFCAFDLLGMWLDRQVLRTMKSFYPQTDKWLDILARAQVSVRNQIWMYIWLSILEFMTDIYILPHNCREPSRTLCCFRFRAANIKGQMQQ